MIRSFLVRASSLALAVAALSACGGASTGESSDGLEVTPPSATVPALGSAAFAATATSVTWSVRETGGGTVTSSGLYTAPSTAGTYTVVATSTADPSVSGTARVTVSTGSAGEVLAFPGAQGFGARATGGRGGRVIKVTNLNTSGTGSLQAALNVNAPRIIVFDVSGVIPGDVTVNYGNVTIAGQTAPGGGITIGGRLYGAYDASVQNIIIRHVRVRPPRCTSGCDADQYDAMQFSLNSRLIFDHISLSHGADETFDLYEADDVTVQWCSIEASQIAPQHSDGATHNYGIINGPDGHRITFHHNLCANHRRRCPAIANGPADVRNNVVYNVQNGFIHHNPASGHFDIVGNYFKDGPSGVLYPFYLDDEANGANGQRYYTYDSYINDPSGGFTGRLDDIWSNPYWGDLGMPSSFRSSTEFDFASEVSGYVHVTTESSTAAYASVLAKVGAWPRDGFTTSTISQVQNNTGVWNPDPPTNLMAGLTPAAPPTDSDGDGMPDAWETAHGLNPASSSDATKVMASGYTAIEEYINGLADQLVN